MYIVFKVHCVKFSDSEGIDCHGEYTVKNNNFVTLESRAT